VEETKLKLAPLHDDRAYIEETEMAFVANPVKLAGPRVAANPQDKNVLIIGARIVVNTQDGSLFAHDVSGDTIGVPFQLIGPKVAANPQDKRVLAMGSRILVITNDGSVFAHDLVGNSIGIPFKLSGPNVAANPQDKHVLIFGNRILVITEDGSVFVHDVNGNVVGVPFKLDGPKVAANPQDKWVLVVGSRIVVITNDGSVFAHDLAGNRVDVPFRLSGPKVAANPQDRRVLAMGNRLLVVTSDGSVFGHQILEDVQPANGGPGVTSASSNNSPSLLLAQLGINGPPVIDMAWRDLDGNINVMVDLLRSPQAVSLRILCLDRPALALDDNNTTKYIAWTGLDQSINLMSSVDGVVFSNKVTLPGKSILGPALKFFRGQLVAAWIDATTGALTMMNGLNGQVVTTLDTSSAAPALTSERFIDGTDALIVAWTGTNSERQLNVMSTLGGFPPSIKVTLPTDGPSAATSFSGPSLGITPGPPGFSSSLVMGWTGLPGGPDNDNHLNVIFSQDFFRTFVNRRTVAPVSGAGLAITNIQGADGNVFCAWVDRQSRINTAFYNDLPVIPA
jgi:RecB family endonuclease NucS